MTATVFVSIGSNIDPEKNVVSCIAALRERFGRLTLSSVYRSKAFGFDGDDFYNMVATFETAMTPETIARMLHEIELEHGRVRGKNRFDARELDLDQLLYGDLVCNANGLCLPRDEITEHAFVLVPLAEISGGRVHPVLGISYAQLWADFSGDRDSLQRTEVNLGRNEDTASSRSN